MSDIDHKEIRLRVLVHGAVFLRLFVPLILLILLTLGLFYAIIKWISEICEDFYMLIFYVRHGDPIYDPDKLTPLGERQAEAVARRLSLFGIDEIYASTSNRAIETARPTCELTGLDFKTLDFLNENYLDGLKIAVSEKKRDWVWSHPDYAPLIASREVREMGDLWYTHPKLEPYHFEKILHPINEQLDAFIASLGYGHDTDSGTYKIAEGTNVEKRVAIFAHECMGKIFMSHLLDIPFPYYSAHFEMHTSAFSVLRIDNRGPNKNPRYEHARAQVLTLSNDSHLYRDAMPLLHRYTNIRERY